MHTLYEVYSVPASRVAKDLPVIRRETDPVGISGKDLYLLYTC